jgi:hypothetical protein
VRFLIHWLLVLKSRDAVKIDISIVLMAELPQCKLLVLNHPPSSRYIRCWYGTIPDLSGLTNLTRVDFGHSSLTGFDQFSKFPAAVEFINLGYNSMKGTIPDSIGDYPSLQYLYMDGNELSGRIPETIGNLVSLKFLNLYGNSLTSLIPISLNNLELKYCNLGGSYYGLCRDISLTQCNPEDTPGIIRHQLTLVCGVSSSDVARKYFFVLTLAALMLL